MTFLNIPWGVRGSSKVRYVSASLFQQWVECRRVRLEGRNLFSSFCCTSRPCEVRQVERRRGKIQI